MSYDIDTLRAICRSGDPNSITSALVELIKLDDEGSVPDIVPLLHSSDEGVRSEAVRALGYLADSEPDLIGPQLIPLLADPDELVRDQAAEAFGRVIFSPALSHLVAMLRQDSSVLVRATAAESVGSYRGMDVIRRLYDAVGDSSEDDIVRAYAARSIGRADPTAALPFIEDLVNRYGREPVVGAALLASGYQLGRREYLVPYLRLLQTAEEDNINRMLVDMEYFAYIPQAPTLADDADQIRHALHVVATRYPAYRRHVQQVLGLLPASSERPDSDE